MSEALTQRIKELEADLEKLKSQLKDKSEAGDDMKSSPSPSENTDSRPDGNTSSSKKGKKAGKDRPFDFSAHPRRHVALRLAYMGWSYQGFAVQENTDNTVEARLFEALLKTQLIQDRQSSNYHRCGRTDKGVSAFSQVSSETHVWCSKIKKQYKILHTLTLSLLHRSSPSICAPHSFVEDWASHSLKMLMLAPKIKLLPLSFHM